MKKLALALTVVTTLVAAGTVAAPAYATGNYVHTSPEAARGNGSPSWHDGGR